MEDRLTYERAIERLETIVNNLENSSVSIEKTIEEYKEGIKLIKYCEEVLARADASIMAVKLEGGKETLVDFNLEEE